LQTVSAVNDAATRERLSAPAVRGFLKLAEVWKLRVEEQIDLLGGSVSRSTLHNWTRGPISTTLNVDQLMRISFMLGIFEGLQRIWRRAPVEADAWIRRQRAEAPFRGLAPLQFMREGGIMGLAATRAYVDGITGGPPSRADYPPPPREGL
jgi:hypothetical protein